MSEPSKRPEPERDPSLLERVFALALPPVGPGPMRQGLPRGLYSYVWRVSAPQQWRLVLLSAAVFPLTMVPLELQRRIVNTAVEHRDLRLLAWLGLAYLVFIVVHGGLKYVRNIYLGRVSEGVIRRLRRRIVRSLEDALGTGDEGARVSMVVSEVERIGNFVGEALATPILQIGVFLSVLGYMLVVEPVMAAIAFAFFVPSILLTPWLQNVINRYSEERIRLLRELSSNMTNGAAPEPAQLDGLVSGVYDRRVRIVGVKSLIKLANNTFAHLAPLSVLVIGGWMVIRGETDVGTIVAFISGFERLNAPVHEQLNFYRYFSEMRVQYRLVMREVGKA